MRCNLIAEYNLDVNTFLFDILLSLPNYQKKIIYECYSIIAKSQSLQILDFNKFTILSFQPLLNKLIEDYKYTEGFVEMHKTENRKLKYELQLFETLFENFATEFFKKINSGKDNENENKESAVIKLFQVFKETMKNNDSKQNKNNTNDEKNKEEKYQKDLQMIFDEIITTLSNFIEQFNNKISTIEAEHKKTVKKLQIENEVNVQTLSSIIKKLEEDLKKSKEEYDKIVNEKNNLEGRFTRLSDANGILTKKLRELSDSVKKLESDKKIMEENHIYEMNKKQKEMEEAIAKLMKEKEEEKNILEGKCRSNINTLNDIIQVKNIETVRIENANKANLSKLIAQFQKEIKGKEELIEKINVEHKEYRKKLDDYHKQKIEHLQKSHTKEFEFLSTKKDELNQAIKKLQEKIEQMGLEMKNKIDDKIKEIKMIHEKEILKYKYQLKLNIFIKENAHSYTKAQKFSLLSLENKLKKMGSNYTKLNEEKVNQGNANEEHLKNLVESYQSKYNKLEIEKKNLFSQLQKLNGDHAELTNNLNTKKSKLDQMEFENKNLSNDLKLAKIRNCDMENQIKELSLGLSQETTKNQKMAKDLSNLKNEKNNLEATSLLANEKNTNKINEYEMKIEYLETCCQDIEKRSENLLKIEKDQNENLNKNLSILENGYKKLTNEINVAKMIIQSHEKTIEQKDQAIKKEKESVNKSATIIQKLEEEIKNKANELSKIANDKEKEISEIDNKFKDSLNYLNNFNSRLKEMSEQEIKENLNNQSLNFLRENVQVGSEISQLFHTLFDLKLLNSLFDENNLKQKNQKSEEKVIRPTNDGDSLKVFDPHLLSHVMLIPSSDFATKSNNIVVSILKNTESTLQLINLLLSLFGRCLDYLKNNKIKEFGIGNVVYLAFESYFSENEKKRDNSKINEIIESITNKIENFFSVYKILKGILDQASNYQFELNGSKLTLSQETNKKFKTFRKNLFDSLKKQVKEA